MTALCNHIQAIFTMCSKEQMVGANAGGSITLMANEKSLRNRTISKLVGQPVCQEAHSSRWIDAAIAAGNGGAIPKPAVVWAFAFINFVPKTLLKTYGVPSRGVPVEEMKRLALDLIGSVISSCCERCGLAAAAFAKMGGIGYTFHVIISLLDSGRTGDVSASPGFLMPNYNIFFAQPLRFAGVVLRCKLSNHPVAGSAFIRLLNGYSHQTQSNFELSSQS